MCTMYTDTMYIDHIKPPLYTPTTPATPTHLPQLHVLPCFVYNDSLSLISAAHMPIYA